MRVFKKIFSITLYGFVLVMLIQWLWPQVIVIARVTYSRYYDITWFMFPHFTNAAYAVLFILPHLLFFGFLLFVIQKVVSKLMPVKKILRILEQLRDSSFLRRLFNFSGNFERDLFTQLGYVTILFLLFVGLYYMLQFYVGAGDQFFELQLYLSRLLIFILVAYFLLFTYSFKESVVQFLKDFLSRPGSPYNLAIVRVVIMFVLWGSYTYNLNENSFWASFPKESRVSLPFMGWFIENVPISAEIYSWVTKVGIVCAVLGIFGLGTNVVLLVNIPLSIYILGVPMFFGKLFHMQIWIWFPAILAFSRCGEVLSLDFIIKKYLLKKSPQTESHAKFGLPLKIIWLHFGIIYFFAGLVKLKDCGLAWALSDSMINQVRMEWVQHYNTLPAFRIDQYPFLLKTGGILVILFELFFPLLIFSRYGRAICFAGGLLMHNLIDYFMYIGFHDLQITYVAIPNWHTLYLKSRMWFTRSISNPHSPAYITFDKLMVEKHFKKLVIIGLSLYLINFTFGVFRVHSWPFSSYPTYSRIVPPVTEYVHFNAYDRNGNAINVHALGKSNGFVMESFTGIEDRIYENMLSNNKSAMKGNVTKLWNIWKANVPPLNNADSVAVYLRRSPINPDSVGIILEDQYLLSFYNSNE